ncbi:hypothetical protein [Roseibium alexandrii]|uniref:Uncharacterized protein n=1 Tax=Roseibium alexandrii (strain DSM 17067 / NCIMB 14079 / DFL-11) TaxID=244592 RepID=A0A5E8H1N9_ROSAD|nr:hypothetical protein [Roseibium alexandrii]EEE46255.2 hypothetical protein SADFL11_3544 [Roseibium alexandrii DFL-11]
MSADTSNEKASPRAEALQEYYFLQGEIGRFDQISHGVKRWSITVCFALIAAGFYRQTAWLFLVSALAAVMFWITEAQWKKYQQILILRIQNIEEYLKSGPVELYTGPRINDHFYSTLEDPGYGWKYSVKLLRLGNVYLPHALIFLFALLVLVLCVFGHVEASF